MVADVEPVEVDVVGDELLVAAPATAILLAVWGFNMLGEGLRDALDPHEV